MNELKHRAWDAKEKVMHKAGFLIDGDGTVYDNTLCDGEIESYSFGSGQIMLIPYTNLKDKNNKEIYNGDWLRWNNDFYWVNWDDFNGCWYGEPHIDNINIGILTAPSFKDSEIVGNKFEHPEHGGKTK